MFFPLKKKWIATCYPDPSVTAPTYYGTEDAALKVFDTVTLTQPFSWNSGKGAIGIDNRSGTSASGKAVFHLGNLSQANPNKYLYVEFGMSGKTDTSGLFLTYVPQGFTVDYLAGGWVFTNQTNTDGTFTGDYGLYEPIHPNPPWEEFSFEMNVPPGSYLWFDYLHIATDCVASVPEPTTMLLLGLGLIGLAGVKRQVQK